MIDMFRSVGRETFGNVEQPQDNFYYWGFVFLALSQFLSASPFKTVKTVAGGIGVLLILFRIISTKYSLREWVIFSFLVLLALITMYFNRRQGFMVTILVMFGIKKLNVRTILKTVMIVGLFSIILSLVVNIVQHGFITEDTVQRTVAGVVIDVMKESYGYGHANLLFLNVFIINAIYLYLKFDTLNIKNIIVTLATTLITFYFTFSRTGLLVYIFMLIVLAIFKSKFGSHRYILKFMMLVPFAILVLSFVLPYLYMNTEIGFIKSLDVALSNRLYYSGESLVVTPFNLFGMKLEGITGRPGFPLTIDNSFVLIYRAYGLFVFALTIYFTYKITKINMAMKDRFTLVSIYVYCFAEAFFIVITMNFALIIIAPLLFKESGPERNLIELIRRETWQKDIKYLTLT